MWYGSKRNQCVQLGGAEAWMPSNILAIGNPIIDQRKIVAREKTLLGFGRTLALGLADQ